MNPLFTQVANWWLGTAITGGVLLLGVAVAMSRVRQPAARQRLGELGILAALAIAALRLGPTWLALPWPTQEAVAPVQQFEPQYLYVNASQSDAAYPVVTLPLSLADVQPVPTVQKKPWLMWIAAGCLGAYFFVASALVVRWLVGQWALARLLRCARPAPKLIQTVMREISPRSRARLVVSPRVAVPMCCGLIRPTIVLPESLVKEANGAALQWVLVHELTHLNRRDPWSLWALGLGQAVYFFLPWFWWMRRQVRLCQEYVADAAAASVGRWADEYAQFLIRFAQCPAAPLGATGVRGRTSDLYRRVSMLCQSTSGIQGRCPKRWALAAAASVLSAAVVLSGIGFAGDPVKKDAGPDDVLILNENLLDESFIIKLDGDGKGGDGKDGGVFIIRAVVDEKGDKDEKKEKKVERRIVINGQPIEGSAKLDLKSIEKDLRKALKGVDEAKADEIVARVTEALKKAQVRMEIDADVPHKVVIEKAHQAMKDAKIDQEQIHKKIAEALIAAKVDGDVNKAELHKKLAEAMYGAKIDLAVPHAQFKAVQPALAGVPGGMVTFHGGLSGTGRLGVVVESPSSTLADQLDLPKDTGVVIKSVVPGSAAEKAGLKGNDILLSLDGKPVPSSGGLVKIVESLKSGEEVKAIVLRKGRKEGIAIKVSEAKSENALFRKLEAKDGDGNVLIGRLAEGHALDADGVKGLFVEAGQNPFAGKVVKVDKAEKSDKSEKSDKKVVNRSVTINDGQFTAKEQDGDLTISVSGKMNDGKLNVTSVSIEEPGAKANYSDMDKVPEKYRARVKKLIANQSDSQLRFEFKAGK